MFIGREQELYTLNKLYNSDKFEFTKDKETIFFTGVETNAKQNLDNFSKCIMEYSTGVSHQRWAM